MKMIFESEKERDDFLENTLGGPSGPCPSDLGFENCIDCHYYICTTSCAECWKNSGVVMEITSKDDRLEEFEDRLEEWMTEDNIEDPYESWDEDEDELKAAMIRNDILKQRCDKLKDLLLNRCHLSRLELCALYKDGELSTNDFAYLMDFDVDEEGKHE